MISGRCTIFLSLHGRIDPETRKSDPHHAGIKELPAASVGTNLMGPYANIASHPVNSDLIPVPSRLLAHPTDFPRKPPTVTRIQSLPFEELTWENFERLCLRVERLNADLECCRLYGIPGQEQEGIDVYSILRATGKYRALQCKQEKRFTAAKVRSAVDLFISGDWASRVVSFVLCTSQSLRSKKLTDEIEKQRERLRALGIGFEIWDAAELDVLLKDQAAIVDDFFGRGCAEMFFASETIDALRNRITGPDVAGLRTKLGTLYAHVFSVHDPGLPVELGGKTTTPLRDRYVLPDIYEERAESGTITLETPQSTQHSKAALPQHEERSDASRSSAAPSTQITRQRRSLNDWLADQTRQIVVGGPGLGKSALLRYVALDLLNDSPVLTHAASPHDTFLPIWLSFPFWTKQIEKSNTVFSLPDIIGSWLHVWSEDRLLPLVEKALNDERLLLLIDGLDEYSNEDAARSALAQLQVFVEQRNCRVIATTRPTGYERLGIQRTNWSVSDLAELTAAQQEQFAVKWFQLQLRVFDSQESMQTQNAERAAADFMAEMRSSTDLGELAKTPLLLGLLLYLKGSSLPLPNSRFRAYGRLVEHLISVHPIARRRAAMVTTGESDLSPDDARITFASLAFYLQSKHREGLVDGHQAEEAISQFLQDENLGLGLVRSEARRQARTLLNFGEQELGLLVRKGPHELGFLHRSFQEHLAAEHIARMPFEEQRRFVGEQCTDSFWREVLLSLLHLTQRPEEVAELVKTIDNHAQSESDRFIALPMLCEVAIGDFQCPVTLSRNICNEAIEEVEKGPWLSHRKNLLHLLLLGLFSPRVRDIVQARIRHWIPGRKWRYGIARSLAEGAVSPEVIECLFRILLDEEETFAGQAAEALASLAQRFPQNADRLVGLLQKPYPISVQVATLEALFNGWPDHSEWPRILIEIENSANADLRLIALRKKILMGIQSITDRSQLLDWATRRVGLRLSLGSVAWALVHGWPGDPEIKTKALEAVRPNNWGDELMDQDIALTILFDGFSTDPETAKAIAALLDDDSKDYIWMHHCERLQSCFAGSSAIIDAIDRWLLRHEPIDTMEVSYFARTGWTETGKRRLLEGLKHSFPFWAAKALIDHWELADPGVAKALVDLAMSPRAAEIGSLLPCILTDSEECRKRLMSLLSDPQCRRPGAVLDGLVQLEHAEHYDDIVSAALPFTEREMFWDSGLGEILFANFQSFESVRNLAERQLDRIDGNLAAVARFFGYDAKLRARLIAAATPLPVVLRSMIVAFLADHSGSLPWAHSLLAQYDLEADAGVKTQMAIAHYRHLVRTREGLAEARERLLRDIICYGPDHVERRQAAFCGLHILGSLDAMLSIPELYHQGRHAHIKLSEGYRTNYPLIEFVLENWKELHGALGERFWECVSDRDRISDWATFCTLADNYPAPRAEALNFIRGAREVAIRPQFLDFVARVQPRSTLLRELCLHSLFPSQNQHENDPEKAVELLGRDFFDDSATRDAIDARMNNQFYMHGHRAIWALCEIVPEMPLLAEEMKQFRFHRSANGDWQIYSSVDMALVCAAGTNDEVFSVIRFLLRGCRPNFRYFATGFYRPILRRVGIDRDLQELLWKTLQDTDNPSERGSFLSLLVSVQGLTPRLREWCRNQFDQPPDSIVASMGTDIASGLQRPVRDFYATALLENLTR